MSRLPVSASIGSAAHTNALVNHVLRPQRACFRPIRWKSSAEAGLRYVRCGGPYIRRIRAGKSFRYIGPAGSLVRDPKTLARIRSLVIPPA